MQWWSRGRTPDRVRRMLQHSDVVVAVVEPDSGVLQAFCRALSDGEFRAVVYDVIVHPDHQGEGLGTQLLDALCAHPLIGGVDRVELFCLPELVPYYTRWGFAPVPPGWRTLTRPAPLAPPDGS